MGQADNNVDVEVLQRLARLETKMDMIISGKDTAERALESSKSSHKRLDDVEILVNEVPVISEKVKRHDQYLFWATTSGLLGVIGLVISIYSLLNR